MLILLHHNGFHGHYTFRIRVPASMAAAIAQWAALSTKDRRDTEPPQFEVSSRVARRLNRAVCGCVDCRCGEQVAHDAGNGRWFAQADTGRYPQAV